MHISLLAVLVNGKIPVVSHIHNNDFESRRLSLKSVLYYLAAQRIKFIFWVSKSAYESYRFIDKLKYKSKVLKNIIDIDKVYSMASEDTNDYRYDVCFLARLVQAKNPMRLIKVLKKVCTCVPKARIAVVGTGEMEEEMKEKCKSLGIDGNVEFLGYKSNPYGILKSSRVMVMTSFSEGTPMSALEALALGVPIVSTPTDGLAELIFDGVNGFTSDNDDTLARQITDIITNDDLHRKLSDGAIEKSRIDNNKEEYADAIVKVYREIKG